VGIRRPKRVWERRQQDRFSFVPGDYSPHHSNHRKRNTCANRARYLDGHPVYRNSPLSGQCGKESNASHQEKNEQNDDY
jgi:hypothetical protein